MEIRLCLKTLPYKDSFILRILIIVSTVTATSKYLPTYILNITLYGHFYSVEIEFDVHTHTI